MVETSYSTARFLEFVMRFKLSYENWHDEGNILSERWFDFDLYGSFFFPKEGEKLTGAGESLKACLEVFGLEPSELVARFGESVKKLHARYPDQKFWEGRDEMTNFTTNNLLEWAAEKFDEAGAAKDKTEPSTTL